MAWQDLELPLEQQSQLDTLAEAFALTFSGKAGERVLQHLRQITIEATPRDLSHEVLAYSEGQRQVVRYIESRIRSWQNRQG